jgi:hypothetical protein
MGRLKKLGSQAVGLEDEILKLRAELSVLHDARPDNGDTFTIRMWDDPGRHDRSGSF